MPRTAVTGYRKASLNDPYSVYFNGTSAYMTVPIVPDPAGWCFAMWLKPSDKGTPTHTFISYNTASFTNGMMVAYGAGKSIIEVIAYNGAATLSNRSIAAAPGDWVHLAATYLPNGTCKIYRNGVLISSATSTGTMSVATAQTLTFSNRSFTPYYARSNMSNIVWQNTTTSWTDDQVRDIYLTNKLPAGTTMYLALDEGTGTTATDTSGNSNNGTLIAPTWTIDTPTKLRTANTFPQRKTPDNLLSNGNFEYAPPFTAATTGSGRWIDGTAAGSLTNSVYKWRLSVGAGTPSAQYDNTVYKNGANSLKVTSGVGGWAEVINGTAKDFFVPVLPSTSYTLSGWIKTEYISGDATVGAQMFAYEYSGAIVGGSLRTTTAIKTTTDWTEYSVTFTTASTTRYLAIGNSIKGHNGTATLSMIAWFDDITLTTTAPYRNRKSIDNLVINGDFESVPTFTAATNTASRYIDGTASGLNAVEFPYKWYTPGTFANATAQYDTSVKLTGTASMKLSTTTTAGLASAITGNNSSAANIKQTMIPVLPSTSYTVSGYCKTNNVATAAAHIDIYEYDGTGTVGATNTTNTLTGTNDWTLVTITFTTASTARYLTLALRNHVAGNVSDAWFDDVTLVKN